MSAMVEILTQVSDTILATKLSYELGCNLLKILAVTFSVTLFVVMTAATDIFIHFLSTHNGPFLAMALWYFELPLSEQQFQQIEELGFPCQRKISSFSMWLLVICVGAEAIAAMKTGKYGMAGYSLFSLWQLCRLAAVAVPRGVIEGLATWMLLKEGLWYWRMRFGSHDTAEQEVGSLKCSACHNIPESKAAM